MKTISSGRLAVALSVAALVTSAVTAGGPALAGAVFATNSDKVDGKHAVSASASIAKRRGKLVATDRRGYLPNTLIRKALDADRLDGLDGAAFARASQVYTKAQVDAMRGRRILGFGTISSDGTFPSINVPGATMSRTGTGSYAITIPGFSPGCTKAFPILFPTLRFGSGEVSAGFGSMACGTGDLSLGISTYNSSGVAADRGVGIMVVAGQPVTEPPTARRDPRAAPRTCTLGPAGVTCR